ncbi:alpha amylase C-terminal domain-containing protein, partial [Vibrio parahaemolyticus]|nr:alpha amylase C-terminal domain-containing protein [Vibrio parahaemolyticus]
EDGDYVDSFDQNSEMYLFIQELAKLRTENKVMTRGEMKVIGSDKAGAGVFAFTRTLDNDEVLVVMNTSNSPMLMNQLDVEQVGGTVFKQQIMSNWAHAPEQLVADENGHVTLELPAKSAVIYSKTSSNQSVNTPDLNIQLAQDWEGQTITGDIVIAGSANANEKLNLV